MLKKAGIAVAAATAGLLAMSPLAFAGGHDGSDGHGGHSSETHVQKGLVNVQDNVIQANACDNNVNVLGIQVSDLTGALGLLGSGTASQTTTCVNDSDN